MSDAVATELVYGFIEMLDFLSVSSQSIVESAEAPSETNVIHLDSAPWKSN